MDTKIDLLSLCIFLLISFFFAFKYGSQCKKLRSSEFFIAMHFFSLVLFGFGEVMYFSDLLSFHYLERLFNTVLLLVISLNFTHVCLLRIDALDEKKIKTLWRIPIIGLLAGSYFEFIYIRIIFIAYLFLCFLVLWQQRQKYRYLFKKLYPIIPFGILLFVISPHQLTWINIGFVWLVFALNPILTLSHVSMSFKTRSFS